jgi:propanol-preferring alcohol dehydrogenase
VQYAKLLGAGAKVVAFARNPEKLAVATRYGADHIIAIEGKSAADIGTELKQATGQAKLDAIMDTVGAPAMMQLGFALLAIAGHYADVGFVGDRIDVPDLSEVMALAAEGKIQHTIETIGFDQINDYLDRLRDNKIVGRAVIQY